MASTGKTPKLGLNQWAGSDDVLRSDFNRDNVKIDEGVVAAEALAATLAENVRAVTGSYMGNGANNREIHLGFSPRFLLLEFVETVSGTMICAFPSIAIIFSNNANNVLTAEDFCITSTGFKVINYHCGNPNAQTVHYLAIR